MGLLTDIKQKHKRRVLTDIWPSRSPVLNPCDFVFWGCLEDEIYSSNLCTEEKLNENIRGEMANIPAEQLQRVNQNLFRWC
jgi:hypothetical protein